MFKLRIKAYEKTLSKYDNSYLQSLLSQVEQPQTTLEKFQTHEHQFSEMIESYFQLFSDPSKLSTVTQDLQ